MTGDVGPAPSVRGPVALLLALSIAAVLLAIASAVALGIVTGNEIAVLAVLTVLAVALSLAGLVLHRIWREAADIERAARAIAVSAVASSATPAQLQTILQALEETVADLHRARRLGLPTPPAARGLAECAALMAAVLADGPVDAPVVGRVGLETNTTGVFPGRRVEFRHNSTH